VIIDWFFLATIVLIGLGAWLAVGLLGALLVGRSIRMSDELEGTDDETPGPWEAGPGSRQVPPTGDGRGARPGR
jgi:hypothetical protein